MQDVGLEKVSPRNVSQSLLCHIYCFRYFNSNPLSVSLSSPALIHKQGTAKPAATTCIENSPPAAKEILQIGKALKTITLHEPLSKSHMNLRGIVSVTLLPLETEATLSLLLVSVLSDHKSRDTFRDTIRPSFGASKYTFNYVAFCPYPVHFNLQRRLRDRFNQNIEQRRIHSRPSKTLTHAKSDLLLGLSSKPLRASTKSSDTQSN